MEKRNKNYKALWKALNSIARTPEEELYSGDTVREMENTIIHCHVFGIKNVDSDTTLNRICDYFELFC